MSRAASLTISDPYDGWLQLNFNRSFSATRRFEVKQRIRLALSEPHFGGLRWWLICPYSGKKVAKFYRPPAGDTFASRDEWCLASGRSAATQGIGRAAYSITAKTRL